MLVRSVKPRRVSKYQEVQFLDPPHGRISKEVGCVNQNAEVVHGCKCINDRCDDPCMSAFIHYSLNIQKVFKHQTQWISQVGSSPLRHAGGQDNQMQGSHGAVMAPEGRKNQLSSGNASYRAYLGSGKSTTSKKVRFTH